MSIENYETVLLGLRAGLLLAAFIGFAWALLAARRDTALTFARMTAQQDQAPNELAQAAWEKRPRENARLSEASTRAFHAAARRDSAVAAALYEEVK